MSPISSSTRILPRAVAGALTATVALGALAATTNADSTPIGALPKGPVATVTTTNGQLVSVALPQRPAASGLTWRLARAVDSRVLRQVSEGDVDSSTVVVFRAVGRGRVTLRFALTKGDSASQALQSQTTRVTVR